MSDMSISVKGDDEALAALKRARRQLDIGADLVLRDIADLARRGIDQVFATRGAAIHRRWPTLKAATVKAKKRLLPFIPDMDPQQPLDLYGDLRAALTQLKSGAHRQFVGARTVKLSVEQSEVNRHDRQKKVGMALTKKGRRRKVRKVKRAKAISNVRSGALGPGLATGTRKQYPDNIIDIHEEGQGHNPRRPMTEIPDAVEEQMEERTRRYLERVAILIAAGV